jgi:hypothetical protein
VRYVAKVFMVKKWYPVELRLCLVRFTVWGLCRRPYRNLCRFSLRMHSEIRRTMWSLATTEGERELFRHENSRSAKIGSTSTALLNYEVSAPPVGQDGGSCSEVKRLNARKEGSVAKKVRVNPGTSTKTVQEQRLRPGGITPRKFRPEVVRRTYAVPFN